MFAIAIISITIGVGVCIAPSIFNLINQSVSKSYISGYNQSVELIDTDNEFYNAEKYNNALKYSNANELDEMKKIILDYENILNYEDEIIGYVEIPKINKSIQIYHDDEEKLTKGVVHLKNTSLPIGGENTHAVLSAHSGYPTQQFFDDIDELENGDVIYIKVLNRVLKYEVYDNEVVEPDDTSSLQIIDGKDILSLVTCYPYGINSHRLIVHAERVDVDDETAENELEVIEDNTSGFDYIYLIMGISVVAIAGFVTALIIYARRKKYKGAEKSAETDKKDL